jgi:hypothetical protein
MHSIHMRVARPAGISASIRSSGRIFRESFGTESDKTAEFTEKPRRERGETLSGTHHFGDRLECCGNHDVPPEAIYGEATFLR